MTRIDLETPLVIDPGTIHDLAAIGGDWSAPGVHLTHQQIAWLARDDDSGGYDGHSTVVYATDDRGVLVGSTAPDGEGGVWLNHDGTPCYPPVGG